MDRQMTQDISREIERQLKTYGLEDVLDAQSVEITRVNPRLLQVRVLPAQKNAPRYFNVRVSESL